MKTCKKCGLEKHPHEFTTEKRNKDGLTGVCRSCGSEKRRERYAAEECVAKRRAEYSSEKNAEKCAAYYAKNAETVKAKAAQYRKENKEKRREYFRLHAEKNSKAIVERVKQWRKKFPSRKTIQEQNRRARKKYNGGRLSKDIVGRLIKLQRGRCAACRNSLATTGHHLDHVIPLALGGENSDSNIQLLCPKCNTQKHCAHPVDFMQRKGFLL